MPSVGVHAVTKRSLIAGWSSCCPLKSPCSCLPLLEVKWRDRKAWQHQQPWVDTKVCPPVPDYREIPHDDFPWGSMEKVGKATNVFRGTMPGFTGGEEVAVKVLLQSSGHMSVTLEDFRREVLIMAQCCHPNLIRLLAVSCDDRLCLVMPLMREGSLKQLLEGSSYRCATVRVRYARDIFGGLSYLHAHSPSIVHRNIKDSNIFLSGDRAILADVGIFPQHSSEIWCDEASDVYYAGVVLIQLLSWQSAQDSALAERNRSPAEVADQHIQWPTEVPEVMLREGRECTHSLNSLRPLSSTVRDHLSFLDSYLTRDECLICVERPRQVSLHPCRHSVMCLDCFCNMNPGHCCPLCQRIVSSTGSCALANLGWALEAKLRPSESHA